MTFIHSRVCLGVLTRELSASSYLAGLLEVRNQGGKVVNQEVPTECHLSVGEGTPDWSVRIEKGINPLTITPRAGRERVRK